MNRSRRSSSSVSRRVLLLLVAGLGEVAVIAFRLAQGHYSSTSYMSKRLLFGDVVMVGILLMAMVREVRRPRRTRAMTGGRVVGHLAKERVEATALTEDRRTAERAAMPLMSGAPWYRRAWSCYRSWPFRWQVAVGILAGYAVIDAAVLFVILP